MTSPQENEEGVVERPTLLITGASGLIGSAIAEAFAGDFKIVGLDIAEPAHSEIEFIKTDLTDDESVRSAVKRVREEYGPEIASVIHLAAYYDFSGEPSPLYDELTVEGTRRLVRELHRQDLDVEQFVFSSTLLVMEPDEEGRHITEFSPTRAEWAYPQSKLQTEKVIHDERGKIPAVILRIAGVYDDQCHSLPISQHIARIWEKQMESYVFPGDATHGQALVHLDDLVKSFVNVVERRDKLKDESVFLIAEPDVMSYEELQETLGQLIHGKEWPTIRIPKAVAKAGAWVQDQIARDEEDKPFIKPWMIDMADDHYDALITHARTKLDWEPTHRLKDSLPSMVDFLKKDPKRFYEENGLPVPEDVEKK